MSITQGEETFVPRGPPGAVAAAAAAAGAPLVKPAGSEGAAVGATEGEGEAGGGELAGVPFEESLSEVCC